MKTLSKIAVLLLIGSLFAAGFLFVRYFTFPADKLFPLEKEFIIVDDGDTINYKEKDIRFLGIDCPEIKREWFEEEAQEPHATQAKEFVEERIKNANAVEAILIKGRDKYARYLGHIFLDGESLSLMLVKKGMAYESVSYYGHNGFVELSAEIKEAGKNVKPRFKEPWIWRKENKKYPE